MISDVLATYLLGTLDGFSFERLIQKLLAARHGDQFVALGGIHDGGADGFFRSILEDRTRVTNFVQMSIQENAAAKIKDTIARLREFGREVKTLTYWTSRKLTVDTLEDDLSEELGITLRIRDWDSVLRLINENEATVKCFEKYFRRELFELTNERSPTPKDNVDLVSDPSVYVFLQFERSERFSKGGLIAPIVDSLIYWALRDTDPDVPQLLTRGALKGRLAELLPAAASIVVPNIDARLERLSAKDGGGNQRVRHYRQSDSYCLPHAMRAELAAESAKELALRADLRKSLCARAKEYGATETEAVAETCERALYRHFHEQGLILAAFLEGRLEGINIFDQIVEEELRATVLSGARLSKESYAAALRVLQRVLYTPLPVEHEFLRRLSKTTLLLFTLKHSPKLIEYFNKMTGKFRLLVGADILVKALSETFLPSEHRHVTNLLKVARATGANLILTEPVVNELFNHLHSTHLEFRNYYAEQEPYITAALASQSDRIMIRTYFYAKLLMKRVTGWRTFVEMFVDFDDLAGKSPRGQMQLQAFLCKTFDLEPLSRAELAKGVDMERADELARALEGKKDVLAKNDALMCFAVYAQRSRGSEHATYDGFGVRTWWLTKETSLLQHTGAVVREHGGTPFIMRPEFLLNFLSASPKAKEIDPVVRDLLPSHVGLQIGQHLDSRHMHKLLEHVDEWKALPDARREIRITEAVDKLKYDRLKRYESNLDLSSSDEADAVLAALRASAESNPH
ncbi:hypothetical protein [Ideonella sp. BN130291]|uniref:hypothetical protein n=1 Tax=Ideonella sp. BN130291 TaxID=3112940 RepID=UPI002E257A5A|nr:hypothetical protein [Ideonella sp. BN130291]